MFMDHKKQEEKLKYLIMMELKDRFDLEDFYVEFELDKEGNLEQYEVNLKFDYLGSIDADWVDFMHDLNKAFSTVEDAISKFPINKNGELDLSLEDFNISGPMIWDFNFVYEDKHLINCSYKILLF